MKKILFITPVNPELTDTGDTKYTWDILRTLKYDTPCYLHVVAYYEQCEDSLNYRKLTSLVDNVTYVPFQSRPHWRLAFSKYPGMIASRKKKSMSQAVEGILEKEQYDVVVVNMFKMSFLIDTINNYPCKKINITHNVEFLVSESIYKHSKGLWKLVYYVDFLKTRYWEKKYLRDYDVVSTICDYDRKIYSSLGWCKTLFTLRPIVHINTDYQQKPHSNIAIVCGSFTWTPKRINIINLIKSKSIELFQKCDKSLLIVGRANPDDIIYINSKPNITATGYVDSVEPYYKNAEIAIVPEMAGGGFKLKITEAIQHHIPIVALENSITDDIIEPNKHYLAANSYDDLIKKSIMLLDNRELQYQLVKSALALFSTEYNISKVNQTIFRYI